MVSFLFQRDRPLIKSLLMEIDRYCARNLQERENRAEAERRHHHEAQHVQLVGSGEETSQFTAGGREEEEEEVKEVDPSLVGSLDDVYPDAPGEMMSEDPFQSVPVAVDNKIPGSLMEMEKKMDAMVVYNSDGESAGMECSSLDSSSLDYGIRGTNPNRMTSPPREEMDQQPDLQPSNRGNEELLPDVVSPHTVTSRDTPDVASSTGSPQQNLPLDLALDAQRPVDLLDQAGNQPLLLSDPSQPVDLTDGLLGGNRTEET